jgi:hypothetical protein
MTITFENENDVIVYALEKVISYARRTPQIFVAQCVWWLASIIVLEQGLINHIDNLNGQEFKRESLATTVQEVWCDTTSLLRANSLGSERDKRDTVLTECEEYLQDLK